MAIIALLLLTLVAQGMGQSVQACTSSVINKRFDDISTNLLRFKYSPDLYREGWRFSGDVGGINCTRDEWKYHLLQLPTLSRLFRVVTESTFLYLREGLQSVKYHLSNFKSQSRREMLKNFETDFNKAKKWLKDNMSEYWTFPEVVLHMFKAIAGIGKVVERAWRGSFGRGWVVNFLGIYIPQELFEIYLVSIQTYYFFELFMLGSWFWNM